MLLIYFISESSVKLRYIFQGIKSVTYNVSIIAKLTIIKLFKSNLMAAKNSVQKSTYIVTEPHKLDSCGLEKDLWRLSSHVHVFS